MQRYYKLFLITIFSAILAVLLLQANNSEHEGVLSAQITVSQPTPTLTPTPTPTPTVPLTVHLSIPKLGIETAVEPVGTDDQGAMVLPQEPDRVGWFAGGYRPGSIGNAVIGGHLDQLTGAPAVFYTLAQLSEGDLVQLTDEFGVIRTFQVTSVSSYPYQEVPLHTVFGGSDQKFLNLITCSGIFLTSEHTYSHRLVVSTVEL